MNEDRDSELAGRSPDRVELGIVDPQTRAIGLAHSQAEALHDLAETERSGLDVLSQLLRRALASRLDAPTAMNPADFTALRAALLVRMGEGEAARALVQDIDTGNYTPALTRAAFGVPGDRTPQPILKRNLRFVAKPLARLVDRRA